MLNSQGWRGGGGGGSVHESSLRPDFFVSFGCSISHARVIVILVSQPASLLLPPILTPSQSSGSKTREEKEGDGWCHRGTQLHS